MTKSFLADTFQTPSLPAFGSAFIEKTPTREPVKVVIYGSKVGVNGIILTLYRLGFAQVHEWSPLLPSPNPGEFMSILTKYIHTS
ncbi:MAG: hypothetical protein ACREPR_07160 [Brasilonema sp.]